jgi:hypothetical protein
MPLARNAMVIPKGSSVFHSLASLRNIDGLCVERDSAKLFAQRRVMRIGKKYLIHSIQCVNKRETRCPQPL